MGASMQVWVLGTEPDYRLRFHRDPDCRRLKRSRREPYKVQLLSLERPEPCITCFPDAPVSPKVWHHWCPQCNKGKIAPCRHNGGVLCEVPTGITAGVGGSNRGVKLQYIWAEHAWKYDRVPS